MSSSIKLLTLVTMFSKLLIAATQELCISEYFLEKDNSVFTCDFLGINGNVDKMDNESGNGYQCIHFLGLPNMKECGEVGLRFKLLFSNAVNSSISLRYLSNLNREVKNEIIDMDGKYGWNHWSKIICADFQNGVNLYVQSSMSIQLDRMLVFMNPQQISDAHNRRPNQKHNIHVKHYSCNDNNTVRYVTQTYNILGKVTAIILIIVTIGSLILVISLSVTMPYNVWDKPKIQILPVRLTDGATASNY